MRLAAHLVNDEPGRLARFAEDLGYSAVVVGEGYRSDAPSVLGHVAASTRRISLTSGVMQIPARPPGLAALTAVTLDALSGGRFRLGLGVSNPDVSDGWYGVRFDRPLARTREYVDIVRRALSGAPVRYQGDFHRLPAGGRDRAPLQLDVPEGTDIPLYIAAVSAANLRLTGEIADGWIGAFVSPESLAGAVAELRAGRAAAGRDLTGFEVMPSLPTMFADDTDTAIDRLRGHYVHFLGMGDPLHNVYAGAARRMGFEHELAVVHDLIAADERAKAAAAIPAELIDRTALVGPVARVADRIRAYRESGATTLTIMLSPARTDHEGRLRLLRKAAEALDLSSAA
ncbi:LLM class flavin-dependent oxidoreductase [Actinosynnema sp. NPDC051121]